MVFERSKILTFFNNKGGVGKTTLAYNVAVGAAQAGYKVCLVDLDPQCNLTRLALGEEQATQSLFQQDTRTIYTILEGIVTAKGDIDLAVSPQPLPAAGGELYLVQGDQRLATYEDLLANFYAQAAGGNEAGYRQTSAISRYIKHMGMDQQFDLFIIDTSPTLGLLNRVILLDTDYFIVPVHPDAFSLQGIENLGRMLEKWKKDWKNTGVALAGKMQSELVLRGEGLFIGYILNSYNVYAKQLIKDHNKWAEQIPTKVREFLAEKHARNGLVTSTVASPLGQTQDYGRIPAKCQEDGIAIFDIDPEVAAHLVPGTKDNLEKAKQEFAELTENILTTITQY